jgi:hypothetical protein
MVEGWTIKMSETYLSAGLKGPELQTWTQLLDSQHGVLKDLDVRFFDPLKARSVASVGCKTK